MLIPKPNPKATEETDLDPIPESGFGRLWYVLSTHLGKLITANLLFILFSLPVITIPAAFTAMTAVVQSVYRKGICFVWDTFWEEFRGEFLPRTLWSLVLLALPVGGWFLGSLFSEVLSYVFSAVLLVLVLMVSGYWFPQMGALTIHSGQCLRNALLLMVLETKSNFLLLVIWGVFGALTIIGWPFSSVLILFALPVFMVLLITAVVTPVLDARIVHETEA